MRLSPDRFTAAGLEEGEELGIGSRVSGVGLDLKPEARSLTPGLSPAAGLEEVQSVFDRLVADTAVQQPLLERGWISLEPGQAGAFGYQASRGVIIADSAQVTDGSHMVISDDHLRNQAAERLLAWVRVGQNVPEVVRSAAQMGMARGIGNVLLLEAEPGVTREAVEQLLASHGLEGPDAAQVVMGDQARIEALPVFAFELFSKKEGLPPVVVLSVAVRLKDEQGREYTLILMA